jgi:hypothetical protein
LAASGAEESSASDRLSANIRQTDFFSAYFVNLNISKLTGFSSGRTFNRPTTLAASTKVNVYTSWSF